MTGGQEYTFRWQFTAMHATTDFKYYVTKPGWNQNHNLSRSDLNLTPFLTVPYNGQRPPQTLSHSGRAAHRAQRPPRDPRGVDGP